MKYKIVRHLEYFGLRSPKTTTVGKSYKLTNSLRLFLRTPYIISTFRCFVYNFTPIQFAVFLINTLLPFIPPKIMKPEIYCKSYKLANNFRLFWEHPIISTFRCIKSCSSYCFIPRYHFFSTTALQHFRAM